MTNKTESSREKLRMYRERQRAQGRFLRQYWLSPEETSLVKAVLYNYRSRETLAKAHLPEFSYELEDA